MALKLTNFKTLNNFLTIFANFYNHFATFLVILIKYKQLGAAALATRRNV